MSSLAFRFVRNHTTKKLRTAPSACEKLLHGRSLDSNTGDAHHAIISERSLSSITRGRDALRIHAVSLYNADYNDGDAAWTDKPSDFLQENEFHLDPKSRKAVEEEEARTMWLYDGSQASREALDGMRKKEAQKARWVENARPPARVSEIDERGRAYGRGSRKTAQARVWIQPGEGEIVVNRKDFVGYFPRESDRDHILAPMVASQTCGKFDVVAHVKGGGLTGQAGAIRLGVARALEKYNPEYRPPMKYLGFMKRDPRMVERKKVGRVKARKSPQWVRR
mmetsp:Transcript_12644/g.28875  ORF Transcript_12644/g.28875 Transcript_12644/m.28875 type:complete len:280 (+) Transcript_12644:87-926(+)